MIEAFRRGFIQVGIIIGIGLSALLLVWFSYSHSHSPYTSEVQKHTQLNNKEGNPNQVEDSSKIESLACFDGRDSPNHPKYYEHQDLDAQKSMAKSTEAIVSLTKASILLGIVGSVLVIWTLALNREAVKIAGKAVSVENRPWLFIEAHVANQMSISKRGASFQFGVKYKNVGNSPAQNVQVLSDEVSFDAHDIRKEVRRAIDRMRVKYIAQTEEQLEESVFPTAEHGDQIQVWHSNNIIERTKTGYGDGIERISPVIVAAVFYRSVIDESVFHTAAAYNVVEVEDGEMGASSIVFVDGHSEPNLDLWMYPKTFGAA